MKSTSNLYVSSKEAKHICDKVQYGEASLLEIIKLNMRIVYCKATRAYSVRNIKLTKAINTYKSNTINSCDKELMKRNLQEKLTK
ncbi:hypothetical protein [Aquimarina longa]|uniref:hypothetical protein n=1 Tax=Aquimarina longa TaxID=1080221 RepID=UPI000781F0E0|nr:hypothetical protein [Aquimarina longa]